MGFLDTSSRHPPNLPTAHPPCQPTNQPTNRQVEPHLVTCLEQLSHQLAQAGSGGPGGAGGDNKPDWTHIYCAVLPPLPLAPSLSLAPLGGAGGMGGSGGGAAGPRGDADAKVAAGLRAAVAALVAKHIGVFRQVGTVLASSD